MQRDANTGKLHACCQRETSEFTRAFTGTWTRSFVSAWQDHNNCFAITATALQVLRSEF